MYATLARDFRERAAQRARGARKRVLVITPLIAAVVFAFVRRKELFGVDLPIRVAALIALVVLGWAFAQNLGRAFGPALFRRLEPSTAGTIGFLIRLVTLGLTVLVALRLAGLRPQTIAVGGAITAVIFGLAAQQTFGNLIAGTVLLSARPFRVGDRIRLHSGGLAGQTEGTVASLGLLYTTLRQGDDRILVPNNVVLASAVVPLREPSGVDVRARLKAHVQPSDVQRLLDHAIDVETRARPHIALEEFEGDELVMRVSARPADDVEGPELADQVLAALCSLERDAGAVLHDADDADDEQGNEDPQPPPRDAELLGAR
jgi:small conductance mechanosensitive channel